MIYQVEVVRVSTANLTRFTCVHCSYSCEAMVTGIGESQALDKWDRDQARAEAASAARQDMRVGLALVRCPQCGKYDDVARRRLFLKWFIGSIVLGFLVGFIAFVIGNGSWIAGVCTWTAVTLAATVSSVLWKPRNVILHSPLVTTKTAPIRRLGL